MLFGSLNTDLSGAEKFGLAVSTLYPGMNKIMAAAADDIFNLQTNPETQFKKTYTSPNIDIATSFITGSANALEEHPYIFMRQAELFTLKQVAHRDGNWPEGQVGSLRALGSANPLTELTMLTQYSANSKHTEGIYQLLLSLADKESCDNMALGKIISGEMERQDDPEAQLYFNCLPLVPARFSHLSDPYYDPGKFCMPTDAAERLAYWLELKNVLPGLARLPYSKTNLEAAFRLDVQTSMPTFYNGKPVAMHWGKRADLTGGISAPILHTMDSAQDLARLEQPVDVLMANHFDPRILIPESSQPITESDATQLAWWEKFRDVILSQVKPGGYLLLTTGFGNSETERSDRRNAMSIVASNLTATGVKVTGLYNNPLNSEIAVLNRLLPENIKEWQKDIILGFASFEMLAARMPA